MFYRAICIDNSMFLTKGTIRVRIFSRVNYPLLKPDGSSTGLDDLSKDPSIIALAERSETDYLDTDAQVFTPFGGGRNFGMLYLPQVNTIGLVTFIDGDDYKPLWVGSYFWADHDPADYDKIRHVNAPSDDRMADGVNKDAFADGTTNFIGLKDAAGDATDSLVIRTKHTTMDKSDGTKMDFEQQNTENLIIINKEEVTVRHYTKWDNGAPKQYQDISIDSKDEASIIIQFVDEDDGKYNKITMTKDDIVLESDDGSDPIASISVKGGTGVTFIDDSDNLVTYADLKTIIEKLEAHSHIRFPGGGSDGLTSGPIVDGGTPLKSAITSPKKDMKATKLFAHPK
jgi:hypothetical protein